MPAKAFSAKQKKKQLQDKRARKREAGGGDDDDNDSNTNDNYNDIHHNIDSAANGSDGSAGHDDPDAADAQVAQNDSHEDEDNQASTTARASSSIGNRSRHAHHAHGPARGGKGQAQRRSGTNAADAKVSSSSATLARGDRRRAAGNAAGVIDLDAGASTSASAGGDAANSVRVNRLNAQPVSKSLRSSLYDPNRYNLHFEKESKAEIERRKAVSREPLKPKPVTDLEVDLDDIYKPGSLIDMPKRPAWDYTHTESKADLLRREEVRFRQYLEAIYAKYSVDELSYFEHNIETWRQLWRVIEISDIILLITDIRHPAFHMPPSLYQHVVKEQGKHLVLVLNKIDLVSPVVTSAWIKYFREKFPELHIAAFSSYPEWAVQDIRDVFRKKRARIGKKRMRAIGVEQVLGACAHLAINKSAGQIDWTQQLKSAGVDPAAALAAASGADAFANLKLADNDDESNGDQDNDNELEDDDNSDSDGELDELALGVVDDDERTVHKDLVTIGFVGYPNVGKSSLINAIMGKKVVSASRTPGHTKHFQTIFLTPQVRLCDCPGLVFPSLVPKQVQILASIYPIAQVSEPYTVIKFLAERVDLIRLLDLQQHPDPDENAKPNPVWSAWDICEAWAEKRGYRTAKAARLDVYRGANSLLRLAVDGRIVLSMKPPGFYAQHKDQIEREGLAPMPVKFSTFASKEHEKRVQEQIRDHRAAESEEGDDSEEDSDGSSNEDTDDEPAASTTKASRAAPKVSNAFALLSDEMD
ncbi:HSR1 protein [Capsaspora owczarzaki ATCC 30864]|uniref:HSR1 protein n=1 Tax=Capsaspora owczarzaki (strain ATCC 30864) TaxID=595528 RepID=UPI0003524FFD|nr:HSR1 protein [Capsaspora owczarzaki ATCC 30864]|eukprot:XP_004348176.2 HSR1 protein [Capsaspora owczarzaki ATCC 30864]